MGGDPLGAHISQQDPVIGAHILHHNGFAGRGIRSLSCATPPPCGYAPLSGAFLYGPPRAARLLPAPCQDARGSPAGGAAGAVPRPLRSVAGDARGGVGTERTRATPVLRLRCPCRPSLLPNVTHPVFPPRCQIRRIYRSPVDPPSTRGSPWPRRGWCCIPIGVWILRACQLGVATLLADRDATFGRGVRVIGTAFARMCDDDQGRGRRRSHGTATSPRS